jgi:hypothetical protein
MAEGTPELVSGEVDLGIGTSRGPAGKSGTGWEREPVFRLVYSTNVLLWEGEMAGDFLKKFIPPPGGGLSRILAGASPVRGIIVHLSKKSVF